MRLEGILCSRPEKRQKARPAWCRVRKADSLLSALLQLVLTVRRDARSRKAALEMVSPNPQHVDPERPSFNQIWSVKRKKEKIPHRKKIPVENYYNSM